MKSPNVRNLQLFLHTPNDDIVSFNNINQDAKVYELKSQIEIKTGILSDIQCLYLSNVKLEDGKTFSEKKIKNGAVLRVKIKERSLEQIYLNSIKGDVRGVFSLGVEFMNDDENEAVDENEASDEINQVEAWNKFVPLRAFQALFAACFKGHMKLVTELIKRSAAHVRMASKNGRTCLHVAASQGHLTCVSLLLGQGVDAKLTDNEGVSAVEMAAENGHIKCEKRIWLFNWNIDVLKGLEQNSRRNNPANEEEIQREELNEVAERYEEQYRQTKPINVCSMFPPISTNQIEDYKRQEKHQIYVKSETPTLPHVDVTRQTENTQPTGNQTRIKSSNITKLVFMKQNSDEKFKQQFRRTKSAPQVKEASTVNKWNHRLTGYNSKKNSDRQEYEKSLFHAPIQITAKPYIFENRLSEGKHFDNLEDMHQNNEQNFQSPTLDHGTIKEVEFPGTTTPELFQENLNYKNSENFPELNNQDKSLYWSMRASYVKEPPPIEKNFVPITMVDSVDLKQVPAKHREIIKSDRDTIKKANEKFKTKEIQSRIKSSTNNTERHAVESEDEAMTKISIHYLPKVQSLETEEKNTVTRIENTITIPELRITESTFIKEDDEEEEEEREEEKKENNDENPNSSRIPDSEVWRPDSSRSFATTDYIAYYRSTQKTYEEWLSEKRLKKKSKENTADKDKQTIEERNETNKKAYEKWLVSKSRQRTRSASEPVDQKNKRLNQSFSIDQSKAKKLTRSISIDSSKSKNLTRTLSNKGCAFDKWLEQKCKNRSKSASPIQTKHKSQDKLRTGMTYEQWLKWKKANKKNHRSNFQEHKNNTSNGVPFEKWLKRKEEERKTQDVINKTKKAQVESEEVWKQESRYNDPHQRTFEEWFLEKSYDHKLEKKYKEAKTINKSHPEDSNLVFDMWLAEKYLNEMKSEKDRLKEVKQGKKSKKKTLQDIAENDSDYSSDSDNSMTSS